MEDLSFLVGKNMVTPEGLDMQMGSFSRSEA